jgi:hypothetical protein
VEDQSLSNNQVTYLDEEKALVHAVQQSETLDTEKVPFFFL